MDNAENKALRDMVEKAVRAGQNGFKEELRSALEKNAAASAEGRAKLHKRIDELQAVLERHIADEGMTDVGRQLKTINRRVIALVIAMAALIFGGVVAWFKWDVTPMWQAAKQVPSEVWGSLVIAALGYLSINLPDPALNFLRRLFNWKKDN